MDKNLNELLNDFKSKNGITSDTALAKKIGLSPAGLYRLRQTYLSGCGRGPSPETILSIAKATGLDAGDVLKASIIA